MEVTAAMVKELRERTQAGMMDCKKALVASDGNMDKAVEYLREKGLAAVAKKAGRVASEGMVDSYIHMGGKIGVLVEVNCETDFVAKTDKFKELCHDVALQIAAAYSGTPDAASRRKRPDDDLVDVVRLGIDVVYDAVCDDAACVGVDLGVALVIVLDVIEDVRDDDDVVKVRNGDCHVEIGDGER